MVTTPRITPALPMRWHLAWEITAGVEGDEFLGCWGGMRSPAVPVRGKKTLPQKALSKEGSASPRACDALVSPLDPS